MCGGECVLGSEPALRITNILGWGWGWSGGGVGLSRKEALANSRAIWGWGWVEVLPLSLPEVEPKE